MTGSSAQPQPQPRVSVVIPSYNVAGYLARALESLQQQTLENFEALIVDDGSTDGTAAVAQGFVERDRRFRLLSRANAGLSSARNWAMDQARADYIALLDADDAYHPDKLRSHVARLDLDPSIGVVYSASRIMRDDGRLTALRLSGKPLHSDPLFALLCKNFVGHGSNGVFRRSLLAEVGNFDPALASAEDIDFWLRIAATGRWGFYREPRALCHYRVRPSGLSYNLACMEQTYSQVLQRAAARAGDRAQPMMPTAWAYMYRYLARLALTARDSAQAEAFMERAWRADASIFWRDGRSLATLLALKLAPLSRRWIAGTLG
ncbi:MAG: glycosyltransferase family 2 protein [Synechococcales cyanobacterium RM1_1_8]|nr:glycosyltransferase family 2 protein [Synechococcales cyanobacterium RM1_1_8]